jgi:spore maturation protein CgeB
VYRSLERLGHEVVAFPWFRYFRAGPGPLGGAISLLKRAENKFLAGPDLARLNADLLALTARQQPDAVLVYRGTHIYARTLRRMRQAAPKAVLAGYNNDDPFAPKQFARLFRHFLEGVPEYDVILAYRQHNLEDYRRAGARRVELLRSWFVSERNHHVDLGPAEREQYACDVAFAGHYENDGRIEYLEAVLQRGWRLHLYGPDWEGVIPPSSPLARLGPIRAVWGEEYNKALCGAKIALCFLSKLNRDTYTRRCFEIPATRTMMLSEYSDDLASLYQPGVEAEFFVGKDDMLGKLERYLADDALRGTVAGRGWQRVHAGGHDVVSRMRQLVGQLETISLTK